MHRPTFLARKILLFALLYLPLSAFAQDAASVPYTANLYRVAGVPVNFILFGVTLLGVAVFHAHTLCVALPQVRKRT